jgi:hypothetical protein
MLKRLPCEQHSKEIIILLISEEEKEMPVENLAEESTSELNLPGVSCGGELLKKTN